MIVITSIIVTADVIMFDGIHFVFMLDSILFIIILTNVITVLLSINFFKKL
jgi:hypothetical protein